MPTEDELQPPGEPGTEETKPPEETKPAASASLSADQVTDLVGRTVSATVKELSKPIEVKHNLLPDAPSGPSVTELNKQIDDLENQIDLAVQDNKPVKNLMRARDQLRDQVFDQERVAPLRAQGSLAVNEVVIDRIKSDPELGEIFTEYEREVMDLLTPSIKAGQVMRLDVIKDATRLIAGRHLGDIRARDKETEIRRKKNEETAPMPGGSNSRTLSALREKQPESIKEVFGERAEEAFRFKRNKGMDEDAFAKRLGFKDKKDWYKKDVELSNNPTLGLDV